MQFSKEELMQIKSGRSYFMAMAVAYCLGTFNDNFYKQAAGLIAVDLGEEQLQGVAIILLALPFVLFSAYAGWFADRFPKRNIVIFSKALELLAMLVGAYGIITVNWYCIMAMVFIMGLQSTIFSPALNGSIPELYPEKYVMQANSYLKLATTVSVLLAMSIAGTVLDCRWFGDSAESGYYLVAITAVVAALIGVVASLGSAKADSPKTKNRFPWEGPWGSVLDIIYFKKDKLLFRAFLCSMFIYGVSVTVITSINALGKTLGLSKTLTGLLTAAIMLGIPLGAFIANKLSERVSWQRYILKAAFVMGVLLLLSGLLIDAGQKGAEQLYLLIPLFLFTGVAGGVFLIPVTSFIQIRPAADEKGRALATQNFLDFIGVIIGGGIYFLISERVSALTVLMIFGGIAVAFSLLMNFKGAGQ
ncbi:MAG: MFS transporter [Gammaproteobacteria bacterium]|nr:MAG: MFS transporter [Gammaproteobacteria bacterium]